MYAQLGQIKFDIINGFDLLSSSKDYNYAEHKLVQNDTKLQYSGKSPDSKSITVQFHRMFCNPSIEFEKLEEAAENHLAMGLVFGNGKYIGRFVISSLGKKVEATDELGNMFCCSVDIGLKEYKANQDELKNQKKTQKKQPIKKKPPAKDKLKAKATSSSKTSSSSKATLLKQKDTATIKKVLRKP